MPEAPIVMNADEADPLAELRRRFGEEPHARWFQEVVAPLVFALADRPSDDAGFRPGHSADTALVALAGLVSAEMSVERTPVRGLAALNAWSNGIHEDCSGIGATEGDDIEAAVQALSEAADRVSVLTHRKLHGDD